MFGVHADSRNVFSEFSCFLMPVQVDFGIAQLCRFKLFLQLRSTKFLGIFVRFGVGGPFGRRLFDFIKRDDLHHFCA